MSDKAKFMRYLLISLLFSAISSFAVLLCFIDINYKYEWIIIILCSLLFWSGTVLEQIFIWKANKLRKTMMLPKERRMFRKPGVISFFKSSFGVASDAALVISIAVFLTLVFTNTGKVFFQYLMLFAIVLTFRFHCFANGKNYLYSIYLQKRRKNDEKHKQKAF